MEETKSKSNAYIIHKTLAVVLDILVVVIFVIIGEINHDKDYALENIVFVGLPFAATFFAIMLIVADDLRSIRSAVIASVLSIPFAIALRLNMPQQIGEDKAQFEIAFFIVSLVFLTGFRALWRYVLGILRPAK